MANFSKKTLDDWKMLAKQELKGNSPENLIWHTPEGIGVKPAYTSADLEEIGWLDSLPGFPPFVGGPKATMYAGRPWTVRQYDAFLDDATICWFFNC